MNKTALYIIGGVALGFIALAVYEHYRDHNGFGGVAVNGNPLTGAATKAQPKKYEGLNVNLALEDGSKGPEMEVLQRYINAYNGNNGLSITGVYDSSTNEALRKITGKSSTNLLEFRYNFLSLKTNGETLADNIVQGKA